MVPRHCVIYEVVLNPASIHLLTSIVEAYEGVGTVTTVDRRLALVHISTAPGCEDVVRAVVEAERLRLGIRSVRETNRFAP
jgi:hypothetical protein